MINTVRGMNASHIYIEECAVCNLGDIVSFYKYALLHCKHSKKRAQLEKKIKFWEDIFK